MKLYEKPFLEVLKYTVKDSLCDTATVSAVEMDKDEDATYDADDVFGN